MGLHVCRVEGFGDLGGARKSRQPSRERISDGIEELQVWLVPEPELWNHLFKDAGVAFALQSCCP